LTNRNKRLDLTQVFWVLFVAILTYMAFSFISGIWIGKTGIFICELSLVIPVLIFLKRNKKSFFQVIHWKPVPFRFYWFGIPVIAGLVILMDELNRLIHALIVMDEALQEGLRSLLIWNSRFEMAMLILGLVIFAPLFEEILFRGFLQSALEQSFSGKKAVIASALCFALFHFQPWCFLQFFLFGLIAGIVFWKTQSILPCIVMHAFHNILVLLISNISQLNFQWYEFYGHVSPLWIAVAILWIYYGMKKILMIKTIFQ